MLCLALLAVLFLATAARVNAQTELFGEGGMTDIGTDASTTITDGTNDPTQEGRAAGAANMPSTGAGTATGNTGGVSAATWGVVIAIAVAALAVVLIFLFVPRATEDTGEGKGRR